MLSQLLTAHWAEVILVVLAVSFNMYAIEAEKGVHLMGSFVHKYKAMLEATNWLLFIGLVIYLSYLLSWYLLISLFILPIVGAALASLFKGFTQFMYLFAMPMFLIIFIVKIMT
jgi:hypothetical protein